MGLGLCRVHSAVLEVQGPFAGDEQEEHGPSGVAKLKVTAGLLRKSIAVFGHNSKNVGCALFFPDALFRRWVGASSTELASAVTDSAQRLCLDTASGLPHNCIMYLYIKQQCRKSPRMYGTGGNIAYRACVELSAATSLDCRPNIRWT